MICRHRKTVNTYTVLVILFLEAVVPNAGVGFLYGNLVNTALLCSTVVDGSQSLVIGKYTENRGRGNIRGNCSTLGIVYRLRCTW